MSSASPKIELRRITKRLFNRFFFAISPFRSQRAPKLLSARLHLFHVLLGRQEVQDRRQGGGEESLTDLVIGFLRQIRGQRSYLYLRKIAVLHPRLRQLQANRLP